MRRICTHGFLALLSFLVLLSAIGLSAIPAIAADWPQWRGIERNSHSPETGLFEKWGESGPKLAWTGEGLGSGYASVAVVDGTIYTTGNFDDSQSAIAINAADGSLAWKQPLTDGPPEHGYDGSRSTPTVDGDRIYVVSSDGKIVCLNRADGAVVWQRPFSDWNGKMMSGWGFSESPLVDGELVICTPGGDQGMLVALNKETGDDVWASKIDDSQGASGLNGKPLQDGAGYSSPMISHGGGVKQYVQLVGAGLIGVRASDGKPLWVYTRVANGTANIPTPLIEGDYVFTSTAYGTGSALLKLKPSRSGGIEAEEVYWLDANKMQNKHGGMVLVEGHIYCGHGNGNGLPICVRLADGEIAWGPERAPGDGETSMVYADGHLILRREDGTVLLIVATPEEFRLVNTFRPDFQDGKSWAHPVISGGKLYLREQDKLMCYELK